MNHFNESSSDSLPVIDPQSQSGGCCRWLNLGGNSSWMLVASGFITLASIGAVAYFAGVATEARRAAAAFQAVRTPVQTDWNWSDLPVANATAAVTSEKFSMATGTISESTEALFVLDHNSGLMQCTVIYPRVGRFMASFTANVADALGANAKGGSYMMVTGTADFLRSSNNPVGESVVYVLDTATGNYACYGVPFNRIALNSNQPQQGLMMLISQGTANPVIDRDNLR